MYILTTREERKMVTQQQLDKALAVYKAACYAAATTDNTAYDAADAASVLMDARQKYWELKKEFGKA